MHVAQAATNSATQCNILYGIWLKYVPTRRNTLQHTATHGNTWQHTAIYCNTLQYSATRCNTLQHTATHCSTLQHTATHCNSLQHTATHFNTLQLTATHCNTLQHTATHCNTLQDTSTARHCKRPQHTAKHCNTLQQQDTATHCNKLQHLVPTRDSVRVRSQHTARHCNTLQDTATHCNTSCTRGRRSCLRNLLNSVSTKKKLCTYKNVNWHFLAESLELTCLALLPIHRALLQMCVGLFRVYVGLLWHLLAGSACNLDPYTLCTCVCAWKNTHTLQKYVSSHFFAESLELTCLDLLQIHRALFQMCVGLVCVYIGLLWHLFAGSLCPLDSYILCTCVRVWKNTHTPQKYLRSHFLAESHELTCLALLQIYRALFQRRVGLFCVYAVLLWHLLPESLHTLDALTIFAGVCVCVWKHTHIQKNTWYHIFSRSLLNSHIWLFCRHTGLFSRGMWVSFACM